MKRSLVLVGILGALLAAFPLAALATTTERDYVIVARGQGQGSTALDDRIAAAQGYVQHRWDELGVIVATSANASFAEELAAGSPCARRLQGRRGAVAPGRARAGRRVPGAERRRRARRRLPVEHAPDQGRPDGRSTATGLGREAGARRGARQRHLEHHPDIEANVNLGAQPVVRPRRAGVDPT